VVGGRLSDALHAVCMKMELIHSSHAEIVCIDGRFFVKRLFLLLCNQAIIEWFG